MTGVIFLCKLIVAHLVADFVLDVPRRDTAYFSSALLRHLLIHLGCLLVVFGFQPDLRWTAALLISHLGVELAKTAAGHALRRYVVASGLAENDWRIQRLRVGLFLLVQLLHLSFIAICWLSATKQWSVINLPLLPSTWIMSIAYLVVIWPVALFISIWVKRWEEDFAGEPEAANNGLLNAGKWIGIIERILVLTFIFSHNFGAIGFLLAAKSIIRIGDLRESEQRKKTEYILIGTLLSFGLTIVIGLCADKLIAIIT